MRWLAALLAAAASVLVLAAGMFGGAGLLQPEIAGGYAPSKLAVSDIPPATLQLYLKAGKDYGIDWAIIAAIGSIETDHGRSNLPGVRSGVNFAGCCAGPMQFYISPFPGRIRAGSSNSSTWGQMGVDGDKDGWKDVYDLADAIPAAARYLVASGAPADYERAIFAYNHAGWYVADVMAKAAQYRGALRAAKKGAALRPGMTPKQVIDEIVLPLARANGISITVAANDAANGRHGPTNSGGLSDHQGPPDQRWAADISNGFNPTPEMDALADALAERFGLAKLNMETSGAAGSSQDSSGGSAVIGFRFQIIYRSTLGGNHDNHVHVGVAKWGS